MKFISKCFYTFVIFTLFTSFINSKSQSHSQSQSQSKIQALQNINSELDNLIGKLDEGNLDGIISSTAKNHSQIIPQTPNQDFSDEIFNAFQSLNHDFLEYEDMLNTTSQTGNKSEFYSNEQNFKKFCNLHNNTQSGTCNKTSYLNEVEQLTNDIERTVSTISKLKKNDNQQKEIAEKIQLIETMKVGILKLSESLQILHKHKNSVRNNLQNVNKMISNMIELYDKYLDLERNVKVKLENELLGIKNDFLNSLDQDHNINKYMKIFQSLNGFYEKIKKGKEQMDPGRYEMYNRFIKQIAAIDSSSSFLKEKIENQIKMINSGESSITPSKRIQMMNKLLFVLKNLKSLNDKIILIKKALENNLKKYSFSNLSNLMTVIKTQKETTEDRHNKLLHLRNALDISHNIFKNKENIGKIKGKIQENLQFAEENIKKKQNIETQKEEAEKIEKEFKRELLKHNIETQTKELNQTKTKIKEKIDIIAMQNKMIQKFLSIYSYTNELKKLRKVFQEKKEKVQLELKIQKMFKILKLLKNVIEYSKLLAKHIQQNNESSKEFGQEYKELIKRAEMLKLDLDNSNGSNEKLEQIRKKINKLGLLYQYLRKGSIHNFIRNELMKKILNVNSSILARIDISRLHMKLNLVKN
jgi:hypothetical protein